MQAAILNLLMRVQEEFDTTLVFISHDLSVVRFISDYVCVMYLGQIMEMGPTEKIYVPPLSPLYRGVALGGSHPRPQGETKENPPGRLGAPAPYLRQRGAAFKRTLSQKEPSAGPLHLRDRASLAGKWQGPLYRLSLAD